MLLHTYIICYVIYRSAMIYRDRVDRESAEL